MIIGIDIGGTSIKGGIYTHEGAFHSGAFEMTTAVDMDAGTNDILNQVVEQIGRIIRETNETIEGVAVSSAGVIDSKEGRVAYAGPTIPDYTGTPLKETIERTYQIPCHVLNDVNAAAVGEVWKSGVQGSKDVTLYLTVGTGIGGAIIANGHLLMGNIGGAGEIGYQMIDGTPYQDLASTTALVNYYKEYQGDGGDQSVSGRIIFEAYDRGEETAKQAVAQLVKQLTKGLVNLTYILNPETIVIGGGIFERADVLLPLIHEEMAQQLMNPLFMPSQIIAATLGNRASAVGAVKFFLDQEGLDA